MRELHLILGGQTLILGEYYGSRFVDGRLPRNRVGARGVEFSAYNTPASTGPAVELPHIWTLGVLLNRAHRETLERIEAIAETRRGADVLIYDYIQPYREEGARTRAIAPGATAAVVDGLTEYFAQFMGRFTAPIEMVQEGAYWRANLQLTETARVEA